MTCAWPVVNEAGTVRQHVDMRMRGEKSRNLLLVRDVEGGGDAIQTLQQCAVQVGGDDLRAFADERFGNGATDALAAQDDLLP